MPPETENKIKLLSTEIRAIIFNKPSWILRNGMSLYMIITASLIAVTFFISYPDIIVVKAKLFSVKRNQLDNSLDATNYYATFYISKTNYGILKPGQKVLLKLLSYPTNKYGIIEGSLDFISKTATDSGYLAKVYLPKGLKTNRNIKIEYNDSLFASGEIITDNVKLSTRLLNRFKPIIRNH